jgi:uncharacterized protein with WD repeat
MELLVNSDGNKKSITIDGITDFNWSPSANIIAFTSFGAENAHPKVGFLEIPSRIIMNNFAFKSTEEFKLCFHPQGNYIAVMNRYKEKSTSKHSKYSVEIYDCRTKTSFPH